MNPSDNQNELIKHPSYYRLDIKCTAGRAELEASDVTYSCPAWLSNESGQGWLFQGDTRDNTKISVKFKAEQDTVFSLRFRGPDKRIEGIRIPLYCLYKQIIINGKSLLQTPIMTWHDVPYIINHSCKAGESLLCEFELMSFEYKRESFLDSLMNMSKDLILKNFDTFVRQLGGGERCWR